jgi:hypothetical protein
MNSNNTARSSLARMSASDASAMVYDFSETLKESQRRRRVKDLEKENAVLARVISETSTEVARLKKLLAGS